MWGKKISDQIRQQALDPTRSYIVQAPAGSGKTGLLIQRFLKLLSTASIPEEVVAITFTRKAAVEMRERILKAFHEAKNYLKPKNDDYKALTWMLAKAVVERNKHFCWQLEINTNRLCILTIDALAHQICSQKPISTGLGVLPSTREGEEAEVFYQHAVEQLLMSDDHANILEQLLLHLDNKADLLKKLLIKMLHQREQWIGYLTDYHSNPDFLKKKLEKALEFVALDAMQQTYNLIDKTLANQLIPLIQFANFNMQQIKPNDYISTCSSVIKLPKINIQNLSAWRGIANLLLTQSGEWRKRINKSVGFPAEAHCKRQKLQMQNLLAQLNTNTPLRMALQAIQSCPPIRYTESQWHLLHALIRLLPLLVTQLQVIFRDHNVVDFTEVTLGALRALSKKTDQPSHCISQRDIQVHHLLIDEFQDTSIIQFRLIEAIVSEWQLNDGRTLFLVGDPMQSIYRFRQSEVGLFLQVQNKGIGNIRLTSLILHKNFRSQKVLIEWFNSVFKQLFPLEANSWLGSIPYSPSYAANENFSLPAEINFYSLASDQEEAQKIVEIIKTYRTKDNNATIALLVRSRSHLIRIIPVLRNALISFNAIEIEALGYRTEIQDLLSLTRAFHHLGDRIAWLAILRAPWCGLTLRDIHSLCLYSGDNHLWIALQQIDILKDLTFDGKKRLKRIIPILSYGLHNHDCLPLAILIEAVWIALGGPACLNKPDELVSVRAYFNLLETIEDEFTIETLTKKLHQLYTPIDNPDPQAIQIMTIHKAKGLEFDYVIVPSLERTPKTNEDLLLQWLERPLLTAGGSELILAPLKAAAEKSDPLHIYLKQIERKKSDNEVVRLFYVAATRAKNGLHFLFTLKKEKDQSIIIPPSNGSFANLLWNACNEKIKKSIFPHNDRKMLKLKQQKKLYRLSSEWTAPVSLITSFHPSLVYHSIPELFSFEPQENKFQVIVGIVMHQLLEKISIEGIKFWNEKRIISSKTFIKRQFLQLGISSSQLDFSVTLIETAIRLTLSDPKGRWILSPHFQHQSEYHLSVINGKDIVHYIVDRTFIDDHGIRWIIDYKSTAVPNEQNISLFLQKQLILHEYQLNQYAKAFQLIESQPIKLGLYFPFCQSWCEWKLNPHNNISHIDSKC